MLQDQAGDLCATSLGGENKFTHHKVAEVARDICIYNRFLVLGEVGAGLMIFLQFSRFDGIFPPGVLFGRPKDGNPLDDPDSGFTSRSTNPIGSTETEVLVS